MTGLGKQLLLVGLMLILPWGLSSCGGDDDDFEPGDDDDVTADDDDDVTADDDDDVTADDDDDVTADDDDDVTADDDDDVTADDDDDVTADDDDDDSATNNGSISGTIQLGGFSPTATAPYDVGCGLFADANFDPVLGPTGPSETGVWLSVASFPVSYVVLFTEGEQVWVACSLDDNGSGLENGPDSGDLAGIHASRVTVSATGIDITLDTLIP